MDKLAILVILAGCGGSKPATEQPKQIDVPAPVAATVARVLGDREVRYEREGGGYEAETRTDLELVMSDDGALIETEVEVPVAIVPESIRAAVTGEIHEAALIVTADGVVYELETADHEVRVDATGQVIGDEQEQDDPDDEDDDG